MLSAKIPSMDGRAWMTVEDFADKIGRSRRQVTRYVREGTVRADRFVDRSGQAHVMIRAAEVDRFFEPVSDWAV